MTIKTIKSGEARIRWRDVLDQVFAGKGDVVIERSGRDVAVLKRIFRRRGIGPVE